MNQTDIPVKQTCECKHVDVNKFNERKCYIASTKKFTKAKYATTSQKFTGYHFNRFTVPPGILIKLNYEGI